MIKHQRIRANFCGVHVIANLRSLSEEGKVIHYRFVIVAGIVVAVVTFEFSKIDATSFPLFWEGRPCAIVEVIDHGRDLALGLSTASPNLNAYTQLSVARA